jgi:hypothetical protein
MARPRLPGLLLLACLALVPSLPAVAQAPDPSPSARELRQTYPLHASPEPGTREAAAPASTPSARPPEPAASQDSPRLAIAAILAIVAFAAGFGLAFRPSRRRSPVPQPAPVPSRGWTAEIEWCEAGREAWFRVVARARRGTATAVVAESARLEWPPAGTSAAPALTAAAEELEARLVAAGWRPLGSGDSWYAKRFAWEAENKEDAWIDKDRRPKITA